MLTAEHASGRRNRITTVLVEPRGEPQSEGDQDQTSSRSGGRSASGAPNGREDAAS